MNQRTPRSRWPSVRLVVLFVLCIQIPDVFSETFRFNWPRPGRATVVETTEASGISLASRYDIAVQARSGKDGYVLRAAIPAISLTGFDPDEHRRLGFFYAVTDRELGGQMLALSAEYPAASDPSLWSTLQLV